MKVLINLWVLIGVFNIWYFIKYDILYDLTEDAYTSFLERYNYMFSLSKKTIGIILQIFIILISPIVFCVIIIENAYKIYRYFKYKIIKLTRRK